MKTIKVIFENPDYNYITSVNPKTTDDENRKYFVGKPFNLGVYPIEDFQKCISIEILKSSECSEVLQLMDKDFSYCEALKTVLKNNPTQTQTVISLVVILGFITSVVIQL